MLTKDKSKKKITLLYQGSGTYFVVIFFVTFVISKLLNMAFRKIFTNVLPQDQMGEYAIILTASMTILTYATINFPSALTRYTITYKNKKKIEDLRNMIFSGFILFIIVETLIISTLVILFFTIGYTPGFLDLENQYVLILILIGAIAFAQIFNTMCYTIAGALQNGRHYSIPIIMRALLQVPFSFIFVIFIKLGVLGLF